MSGLQAHVDEYLRLRRALGFKLKEDERTLGQLVDYLEAAGATHGHHRAGGSVGQAAGRGASEPVGEAAAGRAWVRLLPANDRPDGRDPAAGRVPGSPSARHPVPVLTSRTSVACWPRRGGFATRCARRAMRRCSGCWPCPGMRIGEAVALERSDVDLDAGLITIRKPKGDRARLVPLHPTAAEALRRYASVRDRLCPRPRSRAFFLSSAGTPVLDESLRKAFREIMTRIGVRTEEVRPRVHDLRHRFAVQTLIDWQRSGENIDERITTLSTYLGHVSPADTYWYLSASPELMALAADRLADRFGGVR